MSNMTRGELAMRNSEQWEMVYHMDMWHEYLAYGMYEEAEKERKAYYECKRNLERMKGVK